MKEIILSDEISAAAPNLKVIHIEAEVKNGETDENLWNAIEEACAEIKGKYLLPDINKRPGIAGTRRAYKALGKEPNRYRPSAEALCRRIVNGKGIYRLTTLIDAINLISIITGYSIGGFDLDKVAGDKLTLGVGRHEEQFNAIGRGKLNIEGLPLYRDSEGGIGTPTSDEERTKLTPETKHLLMLVNIYEEDLPVEETIELIRNILTLHASLGAFCYDIISNH